MHQLKARSNTLRKHQIAVYSQRMLHDTLAAETIDYDRNDRGILYFYRDQKSLDAGVAHMQILADDGQQVRVLDRRQMLQIEPSLSGVADRMPAPSTARLMRAEAATSSLQVWRRFVGRAGRRFEPVLKLPASTPRAMR